MKKQNVIIIDDSLASISDLKDELARYEHLHVTGHAQTREKAIKLIIKENPDIVFLDVQLEIDRNTGFDLLQELKALKLVNFIVVFYTAYEKYAIKAIRASAFDFLLKPVDPLQLSVVISRIQANPVFNANTNVEKLINQLCVSQKIGLQTNTTLRFVKLQSIVFIQLEKSSVYKGGQVAVYLVDGEKISLAPSVTLKKIKAKLDDDSFFEISRRCIINIHYLEEVENGDANCCVMCQPYSGVKLKMSRQNLVELRHRYSLV